MEAPNLPLPASDGILRAVNETNRQPLSATSLRPIARDTSDFPDLRRRGCIYVDKTALFHRLVADEGTKCFFLSRPRRFGKSLMISTFEAIFQGRRDLFDGLAISDTDWPWEPHPVLKFNFAGITVRTPEAFDAEFAISVRRSLEAAGIEYAADQPPAWNFARAIETLGADAPAGGKGVVVLIDEYDAPVAHALADVDKAEAIRERLSDFFIQMKDRTGFLRFLMITGVSKFSKLSVFSALSNIVDISLKDDFGTMLGYTEDELTANFEPHLRVHAERMRLPYGDYRAEMKRWYNGFRFTKYDTTTVYNPISIAMALSDKEPAFSATWATTGRPSMLMNFLRREEVVGLDYENVVGVSEQAFDVTDLRTLKPVGMLFQAGYLTIRDYVPEAGLYTLGVPDEEVRRDLATLLVGVSADEDMAWAASLGKRLLISDWPTFFRGLASLYAHLPYGSTEFAPHEESFARPLCTLLASQGLRWRAEDEQSNGRADIVAEHLVGTWIFEIKVDEPVAGAVEQIRRKGYAEPYLATGKPVWAIGLAFDRVSRRLVDAAAERLS